MFSCVSNLFNILKKFEKNIKITMQLKRKLELVIDGIFFLEFPISSIFIIVLIICFLFLFAN